MRQDKYKKIIFITGIILFIAAFNYFDLGQYLTLSYIKDSQSRFQELYTKRPLLVISVYMAVYIMVTALSLPGAAVMTLAGGAFFGFFAGTLIVSFSSSIGAALACIFSRFVLRDWVQERFGDKLEPVNAGIAKDGAFYLFTLRLIPVFPFFVINLVMGLTKMPLITFFWVSQIGMLAGTMVYVNAGKELAKIDSLKGILSPGLIISFVILGLFPITVKKIMNLYKSKL